MEEEVINQVMIVDSSMETSDENSQANVVEATDRRSYKRYTITDTTLAVRDIKVEEVINDTVVTVNKYRTTTVVNKNMETFEEQTSPSPRSLASTSSSQRFADVSGSSLEERDRPIRRSVLGNIDRASQEQAYVQQIFPQRFASDLNLNAFSPLPRDSCPKEFPSLGSSPVESSKDLSKESLFKFPLSQRQLQYSRHKKSARFSSSTSLSEEDRPSLSSRSFIPGDISSIHQSMDVGSINLSSDGGKISPELNFQSEAECKSPSIIGHQKAKTPSDESSEMSVGREGSYFFPISSDKNSSGDSSLPVVEESSLEVIPATESSLDVIPPTESSLDVIPPTESDVSDKGGSTKKKRRPRVPIRRYSIVMRRLSTIVDSPVAREVGEEVKNKTLVHGTLVYTKWNDGHFYPGQVDRVIDPSNNGDDGRFGVLFDDGHMYEARRCDIMMCDLVPMGSIVMAERSEEAVTPQPGPSTPRGRRGQWSKVAEVIGHMSRVDCSKSYLIKFDDGKESIVERRRVTLTLAQASRIFGLKFPSVDHRNLKSPDVSSDNLLEGKRKRRPPTPLSQSEGWELITPLTSPKKKKRTLMMTKASSAPRTKKKKYTAMKERSEAFDPCPPVIICSPSTHHRPIGAKQSSKRALDLSCRPVKVVSDIFKGLTFLITHVWKSPSQLDKERSLLKPQSSLSSCTPESVGSQWEGGLAPMNRDLIVDLIRDGGGTILEDFNIETVSKCKSTCYLISDSAQRTIKYLCCLAFGIPCVSHQWVVHSTNQNKLENHMLYLLPVGYSIEKDMILTRDHHQQSALNGLHVLLRLQNDVINAAWKKVLVAARCRVSVVKGSETLADHLRRSTSKTFLVTESLPHGGGADEAVMAKAGITMVSTEWVVQCIINAKIINPFESYKYRP